MQAFRQLAVWHKAHRLVLEVYAITARFPKDELFCMTSQMRRAAISVAANIVEGSSRRGEKEFARFLQLALASATELEYFALLANDLRLLDGAAAIKLGEDTVEVRRMLYGLLASFNLRSQR